MLRLVQILFVMAVCAATELRAQDTAPSSKPSTESLCAALREGQWTPAAFQDLMNGLAAEKAGRAGIWWALAGEKALAEGKLPPNMKQTVKALRTKLEAQARAGKEARMIWQHASDLVKSMIDRKMPTNAAKALASAQAIAAAYPVESWSRDVEGLKKRVAKVAATVTEKLKDSDVKMLADLESRIAEETEARGADEVEQFRRFAHPDAFAGVNKAVLLRPVDDKSHADLLKLRRTARAIGLAKPLVVQLLGDAEIKVKQDGEYVAAGKDGAESINAAAAHVVELSVLPGETVAFDAMPRQDPTSGFDSTGLGVELFMRATWGGIDVDRKQWNVMAVEKGKRALGGLLWANIGVDKTIEIDGKNPTTMGYMPLGRSPDDPAVITIDVDASEDEMVESIFSSLLDPRGYAYRDRHKAIEKLAQGDAAKFRWIMTQRKEPTFFLRTPSPDDPNPAPKKAK
jgi:hypothetical protein